MIFLIGSGGGGSPAAAGSWTFGLATALPATVADSTILAIVADATAPYYLADAAPTEPSNGDVWFHVTDPEAERMMTNGANDMYCWGAYQWNGTAWVLLTTYKSFLGSWTELPGLPPIGTSLAACTWEQINRIGAAGKAADYFCVGDTKTVTLTTGEAITLRIIDFAHDDLAVTGGGKAPITFDVANCLATTQKMNPTDTNVGGYSGCALYATLTSTIFNTLPVDLQNVIKQVYKKTSAGNQSDSIVTTAEKIFLLSEVEVHGAITCAKTGEGTQYALFTSGGSKVKMVGASAAVWWMRSPLGNQASYFCTVEISGSAYRELSSQLRGVAFGICV